MSLRFARTTAGRPYRFCAVFDILFVGDDVLGVPFIKMSLRFARVVKGAVPYRFVWRLIFLIVGATIGRPRAFEERPYGFNDCLKIRL